MEETEVFANEVEDIKVDSNNQPCQSSSSLLDPYESYFPKPLALDHPYCAIPDVQWLSKKLTSMQSHCYEIELANDSLKLTLQKQNEEFLLRLEKQKDVSLQKQLQAKKVKARIEIRKSRLKKKLDAFKCIEELKRKNLVTQSMEEKLIVLTGSFSPVLLRYIANEKSSKVS